ncbi:MAG: mobile mystery protein B [Candidatus Tantalella remota]|nr:mobile mystery protein B [Candidatus Tantalella remota]
MKFRYPEGATPLNPEEVGGLLLLHITTRSELNRWEQENINEAYEWLSAHKPQDLLNETFIRKLHKKMFENVWRWAGTFRTTEKNIGVHPWQIATQLKNLCDDVDKWLECGSYPPDEIAVRFHHRLVSIHLFPNGNGRHARLMADLLLKHILGKPEFTWGRSDLIRAGKCRNRYMGALRSADDNDYTPLLEFVRS